MSAADVYARVNRAVPAAVTSWQAQVSNACASGLGAVYVARTSSPAVSIAVSLALAAVVQIVTATLVAMACRSPHLGRAIGVVSAGLVRGVVLLGVLALLGSPRSSGAVAAQLLASVAFTAIWLVGVGCIVQGAVNFQVAFRGRFDAAVRAGVDESERRSSVAWDAAAEVAADEHERAGSQLTDVAARLDDVGVAVGSELLAVAEALHLAAYERIRPLSHEMWADAHRPEPDLPVGTVLRRALLTWPVPIGSTVALVSIVIGVGAIPASGIIIGVFAGLVVAAITWACLSVRAAALRVHHQAMAAVALFPLAPLAFAALDGGGTLLGFPANTLGSVVAAIAALALAMLAIVVGGVRRHRASLIADMDALLASGFWAREVASSIEARHVAEAATFLHHRVQSQFLAAALQLELAAQDDDAVSAAQTIARIREQLREPAVDDPIPARVALERVRDEWEGICAVALDIPAMLDLPGRTWEGIDLLVHECVANAVRSGRASQVDVAVRSVGPDAAVVTVIDDGQHRPPRLPGMGMAWMRATFDEIDIELNPTGGMRVVARAGGNALPGS